MLKVVHKATTREQKLMVIAEEICRRMQENARKAEERKKSKNDVERFLQKNSVKAN